MGQWTIVVEGTGAHHNKDYPNDADKMFRKFVEDLKAAGHEVENASFTTSAREKIA